MNIEDVVELIRKSYREDKKIEERDPLDADECDAVAESIRIELQFQEGNIDEEEMTKLLDNLKREEII